MKKFDTACGKLGDINQEDFKQLRGYGAVYDIILQKLGYTINICELGIGGGSSHIRWANLTQGNVIGLDISGPELDKMKPSDFFEDSSTVAQVENYHLLQKRLSQTDQDIRNRLFLHHYTDAFDPKSSGMIVGKYGKLPLVVNDSKHITWAWQYFENAWWECITDDGILVQEDIGRLSGGPYESVKHQALVDAIYQGWIIFDFTDLKAIDKSSTSGESSASNYIGVKFKDDSWNSAFDSLQSRIVKLDNIKQYIKIKQ